MTTWPAIEEGITQARRAATVNGKAASAPQRLGRRPSFAESRVIQSLVIAQPTTCSHQQTSGKIDSPPPGSRVDHCGFGSGQPWARPGVAVSTRAQPTMAAGRMFVDNRRITSLRCP